MTGQGDNQPRSIAFFDLDGTLVIGQTQYLLVSFLRSRGLVPPGFLLGTAIWFAGYKAGLFRVTERARARGAQVLKGLTEDRVAQLMQEFTMGMLLPRLHEQAASALEEHRRKGQCVVVLSAALHPVVRALCEKLRVSEWIAAQCEVRQGLYTGRLKGLTPHGDEKARRAREVIERSGADPADCWAYADHESDLMLLRSVGHPVAVHPRPALLAVAEAGGWPVFP